MLMNHSYEIQMRVLACIAPTVCDLFDSKPLMHAVCKRLGAMYSLLLNKRMQSLYDTSQHPGGNIAFNCRAKKPDGYGKVFLVGPDNETHNVILAAMAQLPEMCVFQRIECFMVRGLCSHEWHRILMCYNYHAPADPTLDKLECKCLVGPTEHGHFNLYTVSVDPWSISHTKTDNADHLEIVQLGERRQLVVRDNKGKACLPCRLEECTAKLYWIPFPATDPVGKVPDPASKHKAGP